MEVTQPPDVVKESLKDRKATIRETTENKKRLLLTLKDVHTLAHVVLITAVAFVTSDRSPRILATKEAK